MKKLVKKIVPKSLIQGLKDTIELLDYRLIKVAAGRIKTSPCRIDLDATVSVMLICLVCCPCIYPGVLP